MNHFLIALRSASKYNIEVGFWFSEAPPSYMISSCDVSSCSNAKRISKSILNVSCHWTLAADEIDKIYRWMTSIASFTSVNHPLLEQDVDY